jgi:hypothetical protein
MEKIGKYVVATIVTIPMLIGISFLLSWFVMQLWNGCLVPAVSGVHTIGWMQAWGIMILSSFLFATSSKK